MRYICGLDSSGIGCYEPMAG